MLSNFHNTYTPYGAAAGGSTGIIPCFRCPDHTKTGGDCEKLLKGHNEFARAARQDENLQADRFDVTSLSHSYISEVSVSTTNAVSFSFIFILLYGRSVTQKTML